MNRECARSIVFGGFCYFFVLSHALCTIPLSSLAFGFPLPPEEDPVGAVLSAESGVFSCLHLQVDHGTFRNPPHT